MKKKSKMALEKKSGREKGNAVDPSKDDQLSCKVGHKKDPKHTKNLNKLTNSALSSRKISRREKRNTVNSGDDDQLPHTEEHKVDGLNDGDMLEDDHANDSTYAQTLRQIGSSTKPRKTKNETNAKTKKIKKDCSRKKKDIQNAIVCKTDESLSEVVAKKVDEMPSVDEDCSRGMKTKKSPKKKKSKMALEEKSGGEKGNAVDPSKDDQLSYKVGHTKDPKHTKNLNKLTNSALSSRKRSKREKGNTVNSGDDDQLPNTEEHKVDGLNDGDMLEDDHAKDSIYAQTSRQIGRSTKPKKTKNEINAKTKKIKKDSSRKKKDIQNAIVCKTDEILSEVIVEKVDEIPSVDEDCSRGMKKWLIKYKESRPGLKILQQRVDDFITAHEEQQEEERKTREALAAEGGWTVVVHHKGRKKTTDTESGITVGSVAPAAVVDKMGKKKNKEVGLDFYRFQKREAQRNEVMMLQSKFEQDKKRIQQLRAARKFRPY